MTNKKRGRPTKHTLTEPIVDTPENIARAIVTTPPKKNWRYQRTDGN